MTLPLSMSPLQIGLIIAGVLLVDRRHPLQLVDRAPGEAAHRRRRSRKTEPGRDPRAASGAQRVEPTLRSRPRRQHRRRTPCLPTVRRRTAVDSEFAPPMDVIEHDVPADVPADVLGRRVVRGARSPSPQSTESHDGGSLRKPDPEIECIVTLQPARAGGGGRARGGIARTAWQAAALVRPHARPTRPWQQLGSDTKGEFVEVAACLLLADRNGAASRAQLDTFTRVVGELAPLLPAAMSVPDPAGETDRAEALDRLCADVDVQLGLTVLVTGAGSVPGTKLRGVAEAAGFRLAAGGRFEWVSEDTGAVHYTLQNLRNEPFTSDTLRAVRHQRRGVRAGRAARGRSAAHLRPDEARGAAHGAEPGRGARRRQPAPARRCRPGRHPQAGRGGGRRRCAPRASNRAARARSLCSEPEPVTAAPAVPAAVSRRAAALRAQILRAQPPLLRRGRADDQRRRVRRAVSRARGAGSGASRRWSRPTRRRSAWAAARAAQFAPVRHRVPMLSIRTETDTTVDGAYEFDARIRRDLKLGARRSAGRLHGGAQVRRPRDEPALRARRAQGGGHARRRRDGRGRHGERAHDPRDPAEARGPRAAAARGARRDLHDPRGTSRSSMRGRRRPGGACT